MRLSFSMKGYMTNCLYSCAMLWKIVAVDHNLKSIPMHQVMQLRKPQKLQYCAQGFKKIICNRHCSLSVMVFGVFMIKFQPSDCICMQFSVISRITTMTTIDCAAIVVVVCNLKPIICIDMFWSNVCFFFGHLTSIFFFKCVFLNNYFLVLASLTN